MAVATQTRPAFSLPTEVSKPSKEWKKQKIIVMGQPGIGKSELFAQDEGSFFIDAEGNLNHLAVKSLPCRSWDDLREIYNLLYMANAEGKFPYSTLVIDTLDRIVHYSAEEVIQQAKKRFIKVADQINSIGDIPEGNGWFYQKNLVGGFLRKLEEFPAAKVVICHVQNKEIAEPTRKYHKDTINIGGQLGGDILAWANHIMHIRASLSGSNLKRTIYTLPRDSMEAKSQGAIIPDSTEWGASPKDNFTKLRQLFT